MNRDKCFILAIWTTIPYFLGHRFLVVWRIKLPDTQDRKYSLSVLRLQLRFWEYCNEAFLNLSFFSQFHLVIVPMLSMRWKSGYHDCTQLS